MGSVMSNINQGGDWTGFLYFNPDAEHPSVFSESGPNTRETQYFKILLDQFEKNDAIQTARMYKTPLNQWQLTNLIFHHRYVVLELSDGSFWSIEKNSQGLTAQRSSTLKGVATNYHGFDRIKGWWKIRGTQLIKSGQGQRSFAELVNFLWGQYELYRTYDVVNDNCKDFAERVYNFSVTEVKDTALEPKF